jgi:hypothetical protein
MKISHLSLVISLSITGMLSAAPGVADAIELDQGWTAQQKAAWFDLSQGSRIAPLTWALAMERPDSTAPLFSDDYLEQFGLIMRDVPGQNVRLPRGFTVEQVDDSSFTITKQRWKSWQASNEKWVGMTCGACHTSEISHQGNTWTVYGGQTQMDLFRAVGMIAEAADQTLSDPAKFDRFAKSVLNKDIVFLPGSGDTEANRKMLRDSVTNWLSTLKGYYDFQHLDLDSAGPGRLDAIGLIYNRIASNVHASNPTYATPGAPVSYPFLWNTHQQDRVQWNGIVPNDIWIGGINFGALARNTGEVIGVFGDVKVTPLLFGGMDGILSPGYNTSINMQNLITHENNLAKLKPPAWPTAWAVPDPERVANGRRLYVDKGCTSCHAPLDRNDLQTQIKVTMSHLAPHNGQPGIGTDPWMACNAVFGTAKTGDMKGMLVPAFKFPSVAPSNTLMGERAYLGDILFSQTVQSVIGQKATLVVDTVLQGPINIAVALVQFLGLQAPPLFPQTVEPNEAPVDRVAREQACLNFDDDRMAYKGRPLTGIWASPPYLHNGSVPTLYDLLLPPDERPKTFYTGGIEFDPVQVGYITTPGGKNTFLFNTSVPGNSNAGHDYGNAQLTDDERWDLVDYMKTL